MSKVILLNGCGSSGKTSIAKSIAHLSSDDWITFGVDTFIGMLPFSKESHFLRFNFENNERGPSTRVSVTPTGDSFFRQMPLFAKQLADAGFNVIIDEVLLEESQLEAYRTALTHHSLLYVNVKCNLKTMNERELLRGDRSIGLSNDQIERVHVGNRAQANLVVDSSHCTPFELARQILENLR